MYFTVSESSKSLFLEVRQGGPWGWGQPKRFGVGPLFTSYLHQAQTRDALRQKKAMPTQAMRQVGIVDAALEYRHLFTGRDGRTLDFVDLRMVLETADRLTGRMVRSKVHQKVTLRFAEALGFKTPGWAFETAMERCVREYLTKFSERNQADIPQ